MRQLASHARLRLAPAPSSALLPTRYDWLGEAAKLSGKTLHLATALLWLASAQQLPGVRLTRRVLRAWSISRDARYDAMARLRDAGLVRCLQLPGRSPHVILLEPGTDRPLSLEQGNLSVRRAPA